MVERPVLVCVKGATEGLVVMVESGGLEVGRSPDNDIVLDDSDVSRFHARLELDNGSLWLRDAGSRNGVFVNDRRIREHRALKVGDMVRFGQHVFEVRWDEPQSEDRAPGGTSEERRSWNFWPFTQSDESE